MNPEIPVCFFDDTKESAVSNIGYKSAITSYEQEKAELVIVKVSNLACQRQDVTHNRNLTLSQDIHLHSSVQVYNGLLQLTFTKPAGHIIVIQYNGLEFLVELHNPELNGGYNVLKLHLLQSQSVHIEWIFFTVILGREDGFVLAHC
ncbi:hypothetical protein POM88_000685 [Heracleum sosnowskyi]|uniref:Uncharacterized protein n=1 Tax=Heracleum sosnowskyi TaxID=360622 RepID=A0AAD8JER0_9APIA|nr:hypothetical protein POM88_000685 [Heracleum sosnowskyi]